MKIWGPFGSATHWKDLFGGEEIFCRSSQRFDVGRPQTAIIGSTMQRLFTKLKVPITEIYAKAISRMRRLGLAQFISYIILLPCLDWNILRLRGSAEDMVISGQKQSFSYFAIGSSFRQGNWCLNNHVMVYLSDLPRLVLAIRIIV